MKTIDTWLQEYSVSHQNPINKTIHWICIPVIVFSFLGILWSIPMPLFITKISAWLNAATIFALITLIYYLRLSFTMAIGFFIAYGAMLAGNYAISLVPDNKLLFISVTLFVVAWIGQFIGHKIEGAKPSLFKDLQFMLIGPAWLMHFIFKKLGISY